MPRVDPVYEMAHQLIYDAKKATIDFNYESSFDIASLA
jgi:hypothetical protein